MSDNRVFSTHGMVKVALLSTLAFVIMYLEIQLPLFPAFMRIDLSDLPAILGAFALGPIAGIFIQLIKNILQHKIFSHPDYTVGIGISPNRCTRSINPHVHSRTLTAGRESHPAPKNISYSIFIIIILPFCKEYNLYYLSKTIFPSITTVSGVTITSRGLPEYIAISASLPSFNEPTLSSIKLALAAYIVIDFNASISS